MKKIMVLLLATTMLFASIGCSNGNGSDSSSGNKVENGGGTGSGNGNGGTGNESGGSGENGGSGSVVTKDDYLGTWTGTIGSDQISITLNTDGSCVAYYSREGFAGEDSNWTFTNSGVTATISGVGSISGKLENGKLSVNYMGQNINLTKVNTSAYVGTWTGSMGVNVSLSVTLNADGTISAENSMLGDTTGFWTVTNSGFIMWLNIGDEIPEEGISGNLQSGKLVVNYMNNEISLTKE